MTVVITNISEAIEFVLEEQRAGILHGIKAGELACFADHDGATGDRNPKRDDDTSLSEPQWINVMSLARASTAFCIVTARDLSFIRDIYFKDHKRNSSRIPRSFSSAGSSGYHFSENIRNYIEDYANEITMPIFDKNGNPHKQDDVEDAIIEMYYITEKLERKFCNNVESDQRRISATALITKGFETNEALEEFKKEGNRLLLKAQEQLGDSISIKSKSSFNEKRTGYIDYTLEDANKNASLSWLLQNKINTKNTKAALSWGDTSPDEEMMKAISDRIGRKKVLCIGVGPKIEGKTLDGGLDASICAEEGSGFSHVDLMHAIMMTVHSPRKMKKLLKQNVVTKDDLYAIDNTKNVPHKGLRRHSYLLGLRR
ncbi:MAG: hypothetical protein FWE93_03590 [Alphaproteobacteria bacterium]|nr:hypothetical protein [Alphaproteobacteria bacterium]